MAQPSGRVKQSPHAPILAGRRPAPPNLGNTAQWELQACADLLPHYAVFPCDVIIHGGGLYAGGLCGINTIVKHFDVISDKQIILFSCGLADPEDPENVAHIGSGLEKVLTPEMREKIRQFHLRGGIDYSRLGLTHKAMMAMLRRVMLKKGYDNLRSEDQMMLDTYGGTVDFTNRESLAPLLNYVRSLP